MNKQFWKILSPFYNMLGILLGLNFLMSISKYLANYYIKLLVDSASESHNQSISVSYVIFLILSLLFSECIRRYKSYFQFDLLPKIKKYVYDYFIERMMKYKYSYYHKRPSNVLLNSLRNLSDGSEEILIAVKDIFWKSCVVLMSIIGSSLIIHKRIGLILCTWLIIWIVICIIFVKYSYSYSVRLYSSKNDLVMYIGDVLSNIITIKTFNTSNYESESSKINSKQVLDIELENNFLFFKINAINASMFFIVLIYSFYVLYAENIATAGNFLLLFTSLMDIYSNLDDLNENFCDISDVSGQINDAMNTLYKEIPSEEKKKKDFEIGHGDIVIKNVLHRYSKESDAVFKIDDELKIAAGTTVAIVGTSGAGKSTLFNLLLGLITCDEGEIIIDDQNIRDYNLSSVRSAFTLIPQEVSLFHRTALENIQYGSFDKKLDEVVSVVKQAQLSEVVTSLKEGYNSIFGKNCNFSGGQKQRIMIARGLLRNAKIFLFDESTSALDAKTEYEILSSINEITKGYTKFIIAHRLKTVKNADLILVFDKGELVQKGTHEELMKKDGLYASLMDLM